MDSDNLFKLCKYKQLIEKMDLMLVDRDKDDFVIKKFNEIIEEFESNNLVLNEQFQNIKKNYNNIFSNRFFKTFI
jgi:Txe/YoeB family toxin of Txe-Axe toxin-antitoxin module